MEAQSEKTIALSIAAQEFISEMRDDEGFDSLIEAMYGIMKELIQDNHIGGEKNRLYLNHLVDVVDFAKMLKQID